MNRLTAELGEVRILARLERRDVTAVTAGFLEELRALWVDTARDAASNGDFVLLMQAIDEARAVGARVQRSSIAIGELTSWGGQPCALR